MFQDLLHTDLKSLKAEMLVGKNSLSRCYPQNEIDYEKIKNCIDHKTYPNLYPLLNVAYTLPISSVTCERSFSVMRRIKTWLRTSMDQSRFSNLAILCIEKDVTNTINSEEIIDQFSKIERKIALKL